VDKVQLIKNYDYNLEVVCESELKSNNNKLIEILENYE